VRENDERQQLLRMPHTVADGYVEFDRLGTSRRQ